jgi:hypothetical protein
MVAARTIRSLELGRDQRDQARGKNACQSVPDLSQAVMYRADLRREVAAHGTHFVAEIAAHGAYFVA